MAVGVIEMAGTAAPPIDNCALLPNPAPRTTMVSPAEMGPSTRLAAFSTIDSQSRRRRRRQAVHPNVHRANALIRLPGRSADADGPVGIGPHALHGEGFAIAEIAGKEQRGKIARELARKAGGHPKSALKRRARRQSVGGGRTAYVDIAGRIQGHDADLIVGTTQIGCGQHARELRVHLCYGGCGNREDLARQPRTPNGGRLEGPGGGLKRILAGPGSARDVKVPVRSDSHCPRSNRRRQRPEQRGPRGIEAINPVRAAYVCAAVRCERERIDWTRELRRSPKVSRVDQTGCGGVELGHKPALHKDGEKPSADGVAVARRLIRPWRDGQMARSRAGQIRRSSGIHGDCNRRGPREICRISHRAVRIQLKEEASARQRVGSFGEPGNRARQ